MSDNLVKEIKSQLHDRVKSPLTSGFVLAWVIWNWKVPIILISTMSYHEKIELINGYARNSGDFFIGLWLLPLLSALAYIYIYPFFSKFPYEYSQKKKKELKIIQQRIEDETPITQDEANRLRKVNQEELLKLQMQLDEYQKRYKSLQELYSSLEQTHNKLPKENEIEVNISGLSDGFKDLLSQLSSDVASKITTQIGLSDPKIINVYLALVRLGGRSSVSNVVSKSTINRVQVEFALGELEKYQIVEDYPGGYELTEYGKRIAVDNDLTN